MRPDVVNGVNLMKAQRLILSDYMIRAEPSHNKELPELGSILTHLQPSLDFDCLSLSGLATASGDDVWRIHSNNSIA